MSLSPLSRARLLVLLTSASLFASTPANAQTENAVATVDTTAIRMAISDVPRNLDTSRQFLRDLHEEIQTSAADTTISGSLRTMRADVERLAAAPAAVEPEQASARTRSDLVLSCQRQISRLEDWARLLEQRADALEVRRGELKTSVELWKRTRSELVADDLGESLLNELDSLSVRQRAVSDELDTHYGGVLQLRTEVSEQAQRLTDLRNRVAGVARPGLWAMLQPESAPLWSLTDSSGEVVGIGEQISDTWREATSSLAEFLRDAAPALVAEALIFVVLLLGIFIARRRAHEDDDPVSGSVASAIFARPVSTAFFCTFVASRSVYSFAPAIFILLLRIVAIVSVLRLAPRILPTRYRAVITSIMLLYLLHMSGLLLLGDTALHRIHLLVVSVLGFAVSSAFLWRERSPDEDRWRLPRRICGRLSLAVFALAGITNLYGAAEFSHVVTDDLLQALYLAIIVIVAMRLVEDLIAIALRNAPFQYLRSVRAHRDMLQRRTTLIIRVLVVFLGARALAEYLDFKQAMIDGVLAVMNAGYTAGAVAITVGDVVAFIFTLWVAVQISRFLQFVLGEDVLPRVSLARGIPQLITRLTHYAVMTFGFMLAVAATGADLGKLTILAGGLGVGVGFGLQSVVNNFISGLILMFERPIQVGDTVEVGTLIGRVRKIGLRASTVRTYSGAEVVVPNANLVANEVVNWTLSDRLRRIELPIGVAYGSDPEQVSELLLSAANAHAESLEHPAPLAVFLGFGESALKFELRFWTREFEEWQRIRGEVTTQVQRSLADAGIEIPFPQRTVHLRPGPGPDQAST